jgi:2-desacetyl-2-hydroxyethyl bacteriochlorophyllide A dehydrogenase
MRALVLHGPGDLRVDQVPDPTPSQRSAAVVRVSHTAICGSDLHLYHGKAAGFPIRVGHEFVGEVVEIGSEVRRVKVGDRVLVAGVIGCDRCAACLGGDVIGCRNGGPRVFGITPDLAGGQAEAVAVPAADTSLRRIPDGISAEQAVLLTDVLPTGWFGAQMADVQPGGTLAVIGLGPVGIAAVLAGLAMGAATVYAIDAVQQRLDRAESLGAVPITAGETAGADTVIDQTHGVGVDSVVEAVGRRSTILDAIRVARIGGSIGVVGVNYETSFPFPMAQTLTRNLTFRSGLCPVAQTWPSLIPLVAAHRIMPEVLITHRMPLSEGPAAYELFDQRDDDVLKVLLDPAS